MNSLEEGIKTALGITPLNMQRLHGGCIADVYRFTLPANNVWNTTEAVLKVGSEKTPSLTPEADMLTYLKQHSNLPVPQVYHATDNLLVMEYLPGQSRFPTKAQTHAAELLAALHQITAPKFGFERDTLIGGLPQPNPWTESWLEFFREHRIHHMATMAYQEGKLPKTLLIRLKNFCNNLDNWLEEPKHPALLHGDAWTTNILAENDRITGFLDPAIYYGHPEIELAFTTLFGTFDTPFFKRYNEINPIQPGFFEIRKDLYNLYPLLVHVRLFGSSYTSDINRILKGVAL